MANFEWYRSFIRIYKHSSVSEAAKSRIMTQPAMSQHLAALEAEVGEPLFTRTARKMIPTERGKELYSGLAPLIEALEETTLGFNAVSSPTHPIVKIGTAPEMFRELVSPLLPLLQMSIHVQLGVAPALVELLEAEQVDLILTSQKFAVPGIEYVPYFTERFVVVAPPETVEPEAGTLKQREAWLLSQRWLSYGLELPIIRRFWRENFNKRPQLKPVHIFPDLHLILAAIQNGAGISLLPTYMLDNVLQAGSVKIICEPFSVTNDIFIAYLLKNRNHPSLIRLIDELKRPQN
ncbi:DNA-binding transcriptional regulator, LysR family [Paenibacillaceae bacterium GAS479]|nr:DNA-binding transcriptional regulator, LysR family [Paenibacillaceae bacterium GAS479]